ncbi:complex III assembly factor LYRM7-like [Pomacea canaliculata]|uniref:complex III assembly factor LYRM7-like n=1 Tax=Pomacea canaliculata TaxID=400727 RepID=UPI000D739F05|nr:complex III assembly factor LYRM7-like [Pomacea canaliculata]
MATRSRALAAFKELHKTCKTVFSGDKKALKASRFKVNSEFKKYKDETDTKTIENHIQWANDSARLLRLTVVQGKLKDDGTTYEVRLRKDTSLEDNTIFNPNADIPMRPQHRRRKEVHSSNLEIDLLKGKKG